MSVGPIPVSEIEKKAEKVGFEEDVASAFKVIIQTLDGSYMESLRNDSGGATSDQPKKGWGPKGSGG